MFRTFAQDLVLARPLIRKHRQDVEAFLAAMGESYRQDSSNLETRYRRNFIRQSLLPLLKEHYPAAAANLLSFSDIAQELFNDVEHLARRWLESVEETLASPAGQATTVGQRWPKTHFFVAPLALVLPQPWSVLQAALRQVWLERGWPQADMSRKHWQAISDLCQHSSGTINLPGTLRAEVSQGWLVIGHV